MEELKVKADTQNLNIVIDFIDNILTKAGCSQDMMSTVDIAVEEIFVNVAHYAYNPVGSGEVTMLAEVHKDTNELKIVFKDSGIPFDPLNAKEPEISGSATQRPVGGLGVYMVKMSMDDVSYEYKNGNNVLSIRKNLVDQ